MISCGYTYINSTSSQIFLSLQGHLIGNFSDDMPLTHRGPGWNSHDSLRRSTFRRRPPAQHCGRGGQGVELLLEVQEARKKMPRLFTTSLMVHGPNQSDLSQAIAYTSCSSIRPFRPAGNRAASELNKRMKSPVRRLLARPEAAT